MGFAICMPYTFKCGKQKFAFHIVIIQHPIL